MVLIKTLGLTEFVSDSLDSRKQKEAETNAKIVDLFKDALDEIKHCRNEQQRVEFHIALACRRITATTTQKGRQGAFEWRFVEWRFLLSNGDFAFDVELLQ